MNMDFWTVVKITAFFLVGLLLALVIFRAATHRFKDPTEAEIEQDARAIYESWSEQAGFVPWVEGGNSTMQDKARTEARRHLEIAG